MENKWTWISELFNHGYMKFYELRDLPVAWQRERGPEESQVGQFSACSWASGTWGVSLAFLPWHLLGSVSPHMALESTRHSTG